MSLKRIFIISALILSQIGTASAQGVVAPQSEAINFEPANATPVNPLPPPGDATPTPGLPMNPQVQGAAPVMSGAQPGMNVPTTLPQLQVPNISNDNSQGQAQQMLQQFMSLFGAQKGAPSEYLPNGKKNPAYDEYLGGSTKPYDGRYGPAANNGEYQGLCNIPPTSQKNPSSFLKGHTCSSRDKDRLVCMVCNLMYEAGNEPREGQLAVVRSVMTRVFSGRYENTVCKNIYAKAQYSWTAERKNHTLPNSSKVDELIKVSMEGMCAKPSGYTNYYAHNLVTPKWGVVGQCAGTRKRIGNHTFCTIDGTATRSIAEVAAAEGLPYSAVKPNGNSADSFR